MKSTSGCGARRSSRQTGVFAVLPKRVPFIIISHPSHRIPHRIASYRITSHRTASHCVLTSHCVLISSFLNSLLIAMQLHPPFYPPTGAKPHAADLRLLRVLRVLRVLFWTLARARCMVLTKTCVFLGNGAHLSLRSVHCRK